MLKFTLTALPSRWSRARLGTAASLMLGVIPAHAQTASQVTPERFEPAPAPRLGGALLPESGSARTPEGADALHLTLAGVIMEGGTPEENALLRQRLTSRTITVSEIYSAARDIETQHARSGRVFVRVVVPAQELNDGSTLRLKLVRGHIEAIDVGALPLPVRKRIAALLGKLVGRDDLTLPQIERQLLLAGQVPGIRLRSTLAPGSGPAASILVVEGAQRLVTGQLTFDNLLPEPLGRYNYGFGINVNSSWGLGELIYLRASGLPNTGNGTSVLDPTPRNRALAGGVVLPIDLDGTSLTVEGVDSRTAPRHDVAMPGFASRFQRVSFRLRNPLALRRTIVAGAELSLDLQDEHFSLIDPLTLPLYQDRVRAVRIAGDLSALVDGDGQVALRATASFGLDALGARSRADATPSLPLSRQGADARFTKLQLEASLNQPIGAGTIVVQARAQTSFGDPLVNAEQIGIAGPDGISPLGSGSFQGDRGYVVRAELQGPVWHWAKAAGAVTPYVFAAAGGVAYERPTLLEWPHMEAGAGGAGLRMFASGADGFTRLNLALEWGRAGFRQFTNHVDRFSIIASLQL